MKTIKKLGSLLFVLMIVLSACTPTADAPKQDAIAAETAETAEGVTAPAASDGTIASHDPTQEERREEMQKADSEDAPMPYQSDPDTEQEGRQEEVQKADEERWQEEAEAEATNQEPENEPEDEPGEGEWHEVDGVRFYTEHRLDDYLEPRPGEPGKYDLDMEALLRDIWGKNVTIYIPNDGFVCTSEPHSGISKISTFDPDKNAGNIKIVVSKNDGDTHCCSTIEIINTPFPVPIASLEGILGFTRELAELTIYVLEETENNPRNNIAGKLGLQHFICGSEP